MCLSLQSLLLGDPRMRHEIFKAQNRGDSHLLHLQRPHVVAMTTIYWLQPEVIRGVSTFWSLRNERLSPSFVFDSQWSTHQPEVTPVHPSCETKSTKVTQSFRGGKMFFLFKKKPRKSLLRRHCPTLTSSSARVAISSGVPISWAITGRRKALDSADCLVHRLHII